MFIEAGGGTRACELTVPRIGCRCGVDDAADCRLGGPSKIVRHMGTGLKRIVIPVDGDQQTANVHASCSRGWYRSPADCGRSCSGPRED